MPASRLPAPLAVFTPQASLALHLKLRRDRFEAFARLADRETRPVEDVLSEYLADLGNHVQQEELFAQDEERPGARRLTQAMRLARHAAEEQERSLSVDDEACEEARRYAGAGYVEITLAVEA